MSTKTQLILLGIFFCDLLRASFDSSTFFKKGWYTCIYYAHRDFFELGQKVSVRSRFCSFLLLSITCGTLTLRAARDIIDMAQTSPVFRIENRAQDVLDAADLIVSHGWFALEMRVVFGWIGSRANPEPLDFAPCPVRILHEMSSYQWFCRVFGNI